MQGNEMMLFQYMEGSSKRFIIPVYQRNYKRQIPRVDEYFAEKDL